MIETYFSRPSTINQLRGGPLGSDLDDLANAFQQQGYAADSIRHYLRGCDQFARWLSRQGYAVSDVNPTLIKHYISGLQRPPSGNSIFEVSHWFDSCDLNSFERSRSRPRFKPWLLEPSIWLANLLMRGHMATERDTESDVPLNTC